MNAASVRAFDFDLQRFSDVIGVDLGTVVKRVSLSLFRKIVERTPVDTGYARGSWVIGVNVLAASPGDRSAYPPGSLANLEETKLSTLDDDPFSVVFITSSAPYIGRLEAGWSPQARNPNGMVAVSVQAEKAELDAAYNAAAAALAAL